MKDLFGLENDIAIVTGVSGNLGPIWAEALLDYGASVFSIDQPAAEVTHDFIRLQTQFGESRIRLFRADVRDQEALEAARQKCLEKMGTPSILVNNAGIDRPPSQSDNSYRLEEIPIEENREILEVNALGAFLAAQVFGRPMVEAGRGSIINIGSLYTTVSPDNRFYAHIESDPPFLKPPAYGASKAALVNFTKYLATQWAPYGVRVNALSPGGVLGNQDEAFKQKFCDRVPMGRMAVPSDLRGPFIFLASQASSYVTGIELRVDGGFTVW